MGCGNNLRIGALTLASTGGYGPDTPYPVKHGAFCLHIEVQDMITMTFVRFF